MEAIDVSKYIRSPVHKAVVSRDYDDLKAILSDLPKLRNPSEIQTETISLAEETKADAISAVIDRRDVPNRDTPLQLAVKLRHAAMVKMLMVAGADWTLQNEQGWNALQEAICSRQEALAMIIVRYYQPLAWAKWCRRLPRVIGTMSRMKDFYLEISFNFESSVVPFVSKVAPSDTYKVWKVGANLRADMTLAGFDGFKIQREEQSILFLGDGSDDGKIPPGSLCMVYHKDKEIMNAMDGAAAPASDEEVKREVAMMSRSNIFRPGIDVTEAVLLPQTNWRHQEKIEMVGPWKAKVYDMHNVVVSIKSRQVPGNTTDDKEPSHENGAEGDDLNDILTEEEQMQLNTALKLDLPDFPNGSDANGFTGSHEHKGEDFNEHRDAGSRKLEKKGWFANWRKKETKYDKQSVYIPPRNSLSSQEKVSGVLGDSSPIKAGRHSVEVAARDKNRKGRVFSKSLKEGNQESEYKKGLRPILWLSPNFPLQTEELLPLLDILANKVKAIRRLRDLLTTKLPTGTFPVKVAIPVVPTIRVLVTFTKFEEIQSDDEFKTPPSSPSSSYESPSPIHLSNSSSSSSSSWLNWTKPSEQSRPTRNRSIRSQPDPFTIPADYTWISAEAKKKKMLQKNKSKKGKSHNL